MQFSPPLPSGPNERTLTTTYPTKGPMILQRSRPPLLETPSTCSTKACSHPMTSFSSAGIGPTFRRSGRRHLPPHAARAREPDIVAVLAESSDHAACGRSCRQSMLGQFARLFQPRVPGGEWGNGAMGNARWTGVRLKDLLDRAGVKAGAVQVRFDGLDEPVVPDAPDFMKSLDIDHARDGEVIVAFGMNGDSYLYSTAFRCAWSCRAGIPPTGSKCSPISRYLTNPTTITGRRRPTGFRDTPGANVRPGETGYKQTPINRMVPRSFVTNLRPGETVKVGAPTLVRGIAFGGDKGIALG